VVLASHPISSSPISGFPVRPSVGSGLLDDDAMILTKTDFIQFLNCPKSLWFLKREPEKYPHGEFSLFLQKLVREGFEVEGYVEKYFEGSDRIVEFQRAFETEDGLYARADALEKTSDGEVVLYEVKSSTSVKTDAAQNHLKDACFQKICAERSGQPIDRVFIVYLNGSYERDGAIDPDELLIFSDITEKVAALVEETDAEIDEALALLRLEEIDRNGCPCLFKSRAHHCDTFSVFNPDLPTPSIYSLPRLSAKQRAKLVSKGLFDLHDVPDDYPFSEQQKLVVRSAKAGAPQIDLGSIRDFVSGFRYPLYFLDFESYASAIPILDRLSPHQHFPFQYSVHVFGADGAVEHREFLERKPRLPDRLIEQMEADIGNEGSVVSWHASFEKTQNREMGKWFPERATFLKDVNDRMVDLEDVFKTAYVDFRFDGSTSIKKVLPIICPDLTYDDLEIKDGTLAMEAWEQMVKAEPAEAGGIAQSLLSYCERDTLAMVEIFRFLMKLPTI
jgi:CRISPR/Cas system-associated exonuclease Cas4 (RecB family)